MNSTVKEYQVYWYSLPSIDNNGLVLIGTYYGNNILYEVEPILANKTLEGFRLYKDSNTYHTMWNGKHLECSCIPYKRYHQECKHILAIKTLGLHK